MLLAVGAFYNVIVPILIPIVIGALLHKKFNFELKSFSKLILFYYVPALAFVKIYQARLSPLLIGAVFSFLVLQMLVLTGIGYCVSKMFGYSKQLLASFINSICLSNNGNIGIPINGMAFDQDPFAMAIQVMVVIFELFVTFSFGILNASKASADLKQSLLQFAKLPVLYAIIAGLTFNFFHITVPEPLLKPIDSISSGMLSFALVSIGAQIASSKLTGNTGPVLLSSLIRLVISPVCAWVLIDLMNLQGITAQALFIASSIPTSRNSAALALEYGNEPDFAGQAVLLSTLLGSITLPIVIHFSQMIG